MSVLSSARGGGLIGPDYIKLCNLIEIKFGISNYSYYFINAAKIDFSNLPSSGSMPSQRYPSHERNKSSNSDIYPWKTGLTSKINFMSSIVLSDPKLRSPVNFSNFQTVFSFLTFLTFLDVSMRKEQQQKFGRGRGETLGKCKKCG